MGVVAVAYGRSVACGVLQDRIDAASAGSTLVLTGCVFSAGATIDKALTIIGGTINVSGNVAALTLAANSIVLDGIHINGPADFPAAYQASQHGIYMSRASTTGIEIRRCTIRNFGNSGMYFRQPSGSYALIDPFIHHNTIYNTGYMGICQLSSDGGTTEYNHVSEVGVSGGPSGNNNSYGIYHGAIVGSESRDGIVQYNTVTDIPRWHGIDNHGGVDMTIRYNTTYRVSRPIFLDWSDMDGPPTRTVIYDNYLGSTTGRSDYRDKVAITLYDTTDVTITYNEISSDYPDMNQYTPSGDDRVYDYTLLSSGLTVNNNSLI